MIVSTSDNYSTTIRVGENSKDFKKSQSFMETSSNEDEDNSEPSQFSSPSHQNVLLTGLNELRLSEQLLDITLWAEKLGFRAHRVVLSSCSDYFRAMFTDPMREQWQTDIHLTGVSSSGLKNLLEYIYTSKLELNLRNIRDVLSASSLLQVTRVVDACSNYLESQLDLENSIDVLTLAEIYSLGILRQKVLRFLSENLSSFSKSEGFHRLSHSQFIQLLDCDCPVDVSENQVLSIALKWLELNGPLKEETFRSILSKIRWENVCEVDVPKKSPLREAVDSYKRKGRLWTRLEGDGAHLINSRGMEKTLVKIGGFGNSGVTNAITYRVSGNWNFLTEIPHVECCNFGVAVLFNELYVVGGCFNQYLQEHIHPYGFRYDPSADQWSTLSPMSRERCRFSLTAVGKRLYAIGGNCEVSESQCYDEPSCEKYDPLTNEWTAISPLPWYDQNYSQHAATAFNECLYISGGLDGDHSVLDVFYSYDTLTDTWKKKTPLPIPRADHVMLKEGNIIYVIGGWCGNEEENRELVSTIHTFDLKTEIWKSETNIPTPRFHCGVTLLNNKIYVVGGFYSDAVFDAKRGLIECYDLKTKSWTEERHYPSDIWEHSCTSLYIPRCREKRETLSS